MKLRMPVAGTMAAVTLALAALAAPPPSEAADLNGFMPQKGQGDVAFSYTRETYDEFWVGETRVAVPNGGSVDTKSSSVWLQWGLTDNLALVADLAYVDASSDGFGLKESGLQDVSALLKVRFFSAGPNNLVGAVGVRTAVSDYVSNAPVAIGHDTTDALFRLVYQFQLEQFYFSQQVGFDLRNKDAPNDYPIYTEIGVTAGRVTFSGFYARLITNDGTDIGDPGFTFPSNRQEYSRIGGKVYGHLTDTLGLAVAYYDTLGDGRNVGDSHGYSGGLVLRF